MKCISGLVWGFSLVNWVSQLAWVMDGKKSKKLNLRVALYGLTDV